MKRLVILAIVIGIAAFAFSQMRSKEDELQIDL